MSDTWTPYTEYTTPPATPVVSYADMQGHLYLDGTDHQDYVETLVDVATRHVQDELGIQLITATRTQIQPTLTRENPILFSPLIDVTSVAKRIAGSDVSQLLVDGTFNALRNNVLIESGSEDVTYDDDEHWEIVFTCGHGTAASDVPAPLVHAVKLIVADLFEHRQSTITGTIVSRIETIDRLLAPFRTWL